MIAPFATTEEAEMEGGATEVVVVATVFAALVTKLVDLVRNLLAEAKVPKATWNVLAAAFGILMAYIWKINLLDNYGSEGIQGFSGQFITGLAIAGSSSGYHELFDVLSSNAKKAKATALEANTRAVSAGAATLDVAGVESATVGPPPRTTPPTTGPVA
jgi:hypothetical protein